MVSRQHHNMKHVCYVGMFLLLCLLWASVGGIEECPFKECSCSSNEILCTQQPPLTTMPRATDIRNTNFQSIYFDGGQITVVTSNSLPANLTRISLMENPIEIIEDDAFADSADTLTVLALSNVRFTRIPDAFLRLNVLQDLTLSNCMILDWNVDAMVHVALTLGTYFTQDMLSYSWPPWVRNATKLEMLGVSGCSLQDIPDDGLDGSINSLKSLILMNNNLTSIPKAVAKLMAVTSISLDSNKISDVNWLPVNGKLQSLTLDSNRLHDSSQLSSVLRPHNNTLTQLSIQTNLLPTFPSLDFLVHISQLDLTNNRLSDSNFGSLPPSMKKLDMGQNFLPRIPRFLSGLKSVKDLLLSHNSLTQLDGVAFPPSTRKVEVDYNLITAITDTSFPDSSSITTIIINNNPLATISSNAFRNLPDLQDVNFQHTKLTRLPLGVSSLTKAKSIDFSNIDSLVCTCLENSLRGWILSHSSEVSGNCGPTSIYDFFSVLSSGCP